MRDDVGDGPGERLAKPERHARILRLLGQGPTLRVADLAAELGVSTETIRRDLDALYGQGLLERTYGGAVRPFGTEPTLSRRQRIFARERAAIARLVADLLSPGQVVAIGAGATTLSVARRIAQHPGPLTVLTHSFGIATELSRNPGIHVLMCPGRVDAGEDCVTGSHAVEFLQRFHVNVAILGASGLTEDGPNEVSDANATVYAAMLRRAAETIVVADHSKFERPSTMIYGEWRLVRRLATDRLPAGRLAEALTAARVAVMMPSGDAPGTTAAQVGAGRLGTERVRLTPEAEEGLRPRQGGVGAVRGSLP